MPAQSTSAADVARVQQEIAGLVALTEKEPDRLYGFARLATLLDGLGDTEQAIAQYRRLLQRQPALAAAHYNLALLYRKSKRWRESMASYEEALRSGIDRAEEVWSNMGVLCAEMRRSDAAAEMYERALEIDPRYVPALFNRGGLAEEAGRKEEALAFYRRILEINPAHAGALARLARAGRVTDAGDPLLATLTSAVESAKADPADREELSFALGKVLDDLGRYDEACEAWRTANELARRRHPPYDRRASEEAFARVIETFDRGWIASRASPSAASPIFVCGMFRSGSTLVEQMLSAHPAVTAGGELDLLPWLVARRLAPYPERAARAGREEIRKAGDEYLALVRELFPEAARVTDKRPDNFLWLGLVKAMFPDARIVHTRRNALDNCLSIWSQHLGGLTYATDVANAAHYYRQHERLMRHWMACFGDDVFTVDYDELVRSPEPQLRRLLEFLGLEWDANCLEFQHAGTAVKTASVWQVREPLNARASGRRRHYARLLQAAEAELSREPPADGAGELARRADTLLRQGRYAEGEALLRRGLAQAPDDRPARHNLAVALMRQGRADEALAEAERLLADAPDEAGPLNLKAAVLLQRLEYDAAIAIYDGILRRQPDRAGVWSNLGHALRAVGRLEESIAAYRRAAALAPDRGEAYWNLANLKTAPLTDEDVASMQSALGRSGLTPEDRVHFHFALGKALEERSAFEESFHHYAEGNRLRRASIHYDPDELSRYVARCRQLFTAEFFARHRAFGSGSEAPIFVVGLPRSGSTLVEQILASHSRVEGTRELTHVMALAKSLAGREPPYPDALAELDEAELTRLGQAYLERAGAQRKSGTPFFVDKMPNNFAHLALIHLMLPGARIVDVRRHPMACGLSLYTHLFAHGQHFSYSLEDIGRYYRDYADLMAHFDAVLPGRVHRVSYESLVEDTEGEVRRLLGYCRLPFEEACLRWFENPRLVTTASSEQVREPISRRALAHWRNYERWLEPLAERAGPPAPGYPREMPIE